MKYCALVSGGKDSCMNLLYCQKEGHELVACANLRPKPHRPEEIDSFMFQTVGAKALNNLSECLGVPLYIHELDEDSATHEVDNVVQVLQQVLRDFPDIEGVSVGAIGSVYQQTRVDSACKRLGLTALSYLWQRDQSELLQDIVSSGMEARMIKVAGYGLNEKHLGKTLGELQPTIENLHQKYGLYPCGEGGEYETMVFDGPQFKKRLIMENTKTIEHSSGDVYYLTFDTRVVAKEEKQVQPRVVEVLRPPLIDPDMCTMMPQPNWKQPSETLSLHRETFKATFSGSLATVFQPLRKFYTTHNVTQTIHVLVILDNMANFQEFNKLYNAVFDFEAPPSRKCIAAGIDDQVQITVMGGQNDWESKTMHVQGLSYWAPANIGPYSQSRLYYGVNYMAGQIGLIPSSLQLETDQHIQCQLALQNALRIIHAVHGQDNWAVLYGVVYTVCAEIREYVESLWPFKLPLVVAQISELPRGAVAEWDIATVDLRYVENHAPEDNDEAEELYYYKPEYVKTESGYVCNFGNQTFTVQKGVGRGLVLSTEPGYDLSLSSLHFASSPVESVTMFQGF